MSAGIQRKEETRAVGGDVGAESVSLPRTARVLFIAPQPFFANRGTPFNVKALVETIARGGAPVDLLVYPIGEDVELPSNVNVLRAFPIPGINSVPIGPSWRKLVLDVPLSLSALWLVLTRNYKIIHGVEEGGVLAGFFGLLTRKPFVFDMDSSMPEQLKDSGFFKSKFLLGLVSSIEAFFIRKAAAVLTVCKDLSDKVLAITPSANVHQIEDCPLESAGETQESDVLEWKFRFGLGEKKVILYTGNFEPYQGIDLLFDSFAELVKLGDSDKARLVMVGGGDGASDRIAAYKEKAKSLGIGEQVVFTGQRPPEEMGVAMAAADVLVSPRITGGNTPLKIYSYMAASRPIVATDIHSHTQVLSSENAFLAGDSPREFALALSDACFGDEAKRNKIVSAAKEDVDLNYSRKAFDRKVLKLYTELLG